MRRTGSTGKGYAALHSTGAQRSMSASAKLSPREMQLDAVTSANRRETRQFLRKQHCRARSRSQSQQATAVPPAPSSMPSLPIPGTETSVPRPAGPPADTPSADPTEASSTAQAVAVLHVHREEPPCARVDSPVTVAGRSESASTSCASIICSESASSSATGSHAGTLEGATGLTFWHSTANSDASCRLVNSEEHVALASQPQVRSRKVAKQRSNGMVQRVRAAVANCAAVMQRHKIEECENAASAANSPATNPTQPVSLKPQQQQHRLTTANSQGSMVHSVRST
jgi:hypothetical protein